MWLFSTEITPVNERKLNLQKQPQDKRDLPFAPMVTTQVVLPKARNLSMIPLFMPPVYNQGGVGSCTANATAFAFQWASAQQRLLWRNMPSRLFLYYNARVMNGNVNSDTGSHIRDAMKSVNKEGICAESSWQYDQSAWMIKPYPQCYEEALKHKSLAYYSVKKDLYDIKLAIYNRYPVVFGATVFAGIYSDPTTWNKYVLPKPRVGEKSIGGHAMAIVGYDDVRQVFKVRNSWGDGWGEKGYLYIPYSYVLRYGFDFWVMEKIA